MWQSNGNTRIIDSSLRKFYFSSGMLTFSQPGNNTKAARRQGGKAGRQGGKAARRQGGKAARRQGGKTQDSRLKTQDSRLKTQDSLETRDECE